MPRTLPPPLAVEMPERFEADFDRLICFPVSEERNRNKYRHDPGNGANDYRLHERRLKIKNILNGEPKQSDKCPR
jgi:hypothetical protein